MLGVGCYVGLNNKQSNRRPAMTRTQELIRQFKNDNPIHDCLGCTGGRWKWQRYLDGIDLRYGYNSKRMAELARVDAAKKHAAEIIYNDEPVACGCGKMMPRYEYDAIGMCANCLNEKYPNILD
jgi:hypothetical protein